MMYLQPFPPKCSLCNAGLSGQHDTFNHLRGSRHLKNMEYAAEADSELKEVQNARALEDTCFLGGVAVLLSTTKWWGLHERHGFDVTRLLELLPLEQERRRAVEAVEQEIRAQPGDSAWLKVESRFFFQWDDSLSGAPLPVFKAPYLDDMIRRCTLENMPPLLQVPSYFPVPVPPLTGYRRRCKAQGYPHVHRGGRLGIALAKKKGLAIESYDVLCGTSFIKALSGIANTKDTYYLQRFGTNRTICVLHIPERYHNPNTVGHAVERLLCPSQTGASFEAATTLVIGGKRFLVMSEVDAVDENGDVVELKSSSNKVGKAFVCRKVALQVRINGSQYVVGCALDKGQTNLIGVERISTAAEDDDLNLLGKRAVYNLNRLIQDLAEADGSTPASVDSVGSVWKMNFDDLRVPYLEAADPGVHVLPQGSMNEHCDPPPSVVGQRSCRFWGPGTGYNCRSGDACPFSHDEASSAWTPEHADWGGGRGRGRGRGAPAFPFSGVQPPPKKARTHPAGRGSPRSVGRGVADTWCWGSGMGY
eukprot:Hpha_TRINITY_DN20599_c0_g1::TRINITY_DN20599_c0_g1_i1::g.30752::m.30752